MKSIFGGIKSYFSKSQDTPPGANGTAVSSSPAIRKESSLKDNLGPIRERGPLNDDDFSNLGPSRSRSGFGVGDSDPFRDDPYDRESRRRTEPAIAPAPRTCKIEKQIDSNLEELGGGLSRLKNLALGLGDEIEDQNLMLGRITTKAERAEDTLQYQNRQMKQILRK